jgi:hypothetical protein
MGRCYDKSQLMILQSQLGIQTYQRILYNIPRKFFLASNREEGGNNLLEKVKQLVSLFLKSQSSLCFTLLSHKNFSFAS